MIPLPRALCALLLLSLSQADAQVNIETYRGKSGIAGAARLSFSSDIGNVDVVRSDGAGNVTLDSRRGTVLAVVRGATGFLGGKRYANSGVLHLRYTRKLLPFFYPEVFVQGDYDRARQLDARSLLGAGARWNLVRQDSGYLAVGSALMWEQERLDLLPTDAHDDNTSIGRLSLYINLRATTGQDVSVSTTAYVQPALDDPGDARWLGTMELTTPLLGPLTQTTVFDFRIDSDPPQGVKKVDAKVSASFGVRFGG